LIHGWRAGAALTPGYFLSCFQRDDYLVATTTTRAARAGTPVRSRY